MDQLTDTQILYGFIAFIVLTTLIVTRKLLMKLIVLLGKLIVEVTNILLAVIVGIFFGGIVWLVIHALLNNTPLDQQFRLLISGIVGIIVGFYLMCIVIKSRRTQKDTDKTAIMLTGGEAVGKTTVLSLMYHEFNKNSIFPVKGIGDTGVILDEAYQTLCAMIKQLNLIDPPRLTGTAGIVKYNFSIEDRQFTVCDTAGGLTKTRDLKGKDFREFKSVISKSSVIINVIDGAALVAGGPFLASRDNVPMQIRDLLIQYKGDRQCLILFVITKCEAWIKTESGMETLRNEFEKNYKPVLNWVKNNPNCMGMFIPVKTMGCFEFSHIDDEKLIYKKNDLMFSQEHVGKPMLYAVRYCMNQRLEPIENHFTCYGNKSFLAGRIRN